MKSDDTVSFSFENFWGWLKNILSMRITRVLLGMFFVAAVTYATFVGSLVLMGYTTYAVVGNLAGWASIVSFVGACIPGVNALVLLGGFIGWGVAVLCQSSMQAIAVSAVYYALSAGVLASIAARMFSNRATA